MDVFGEKGNSPVVACLNEAVVVEGVTTGDGLDVLVLQWMGKTTVFSSGLDGVDVFGGEAMEEDTGATLL